MMVATTSHIAQFVRLVSRVWFACAMVVAVLATAAFAPRAQLAFAALDQRLSAAATMSDPVGVVFDDTADSEALNDASGEGGLLDDAILASAGAAAFPASTAFLRLIGSAQALPRSAPQHLPFEPPRA